MRRRDFVALVGSVAVGSPLLARAQPTGKIYRIGFLANDPTIPTTAAGKAFVEGLREKGFVEGRNLMIERRFAEGRSDLLPKFATELVELEPDLIVATSNGAVIATKALTKKIPIVMVNVTDPVRAGIVPSLAHPGGNVTGVVLQVSAEVAGKRLQLLKDVVPRISRLAVPITPEYPGDVAQWKVLERAAQPLGVTLQAYPVRQGSDFAGAFSKMNHDRPDALFGLNNGLTLTYRRVIVAFAAEHRLPAIYAFADVTRDGGLMSYGASRMDTFRRAASFVAKILGGENPGDLPIEQPTKFELVINLKTAKTLGIRFTRDFQLLADEIVE